MKAVWGSATYILIKHQQWFLGVSFGDKSMVLASFDQWDSLPAHLSILAEF